MADKNLLERIAKHAAHIKRIEVPEWGAASGEPLVFFSPAMKANVYEECRQAATTGEVVDMSLFRAMLIYNQAQDDAGKRLFEIGDVALLINADADTLTRVAEQVTAAATIKDLEKN